MGITVEQIIKKLPSNYNITLIAGEKGIYKENISWVSVVEDFSGRFVHENKMILTSFINIKNPDNILDIVKILQSKKTSALIIKTGKYIDKIPKEVIFYCNEAGLPLYTIPLDVMMVDIVKDISRILIYTGSERKSLSDFIKSIILNPNNINSKIKNLNGYNISSEQFFCPVVIKPVLRSYNPDLLDICLRTIVVSLDHIAAKSEDLKTAVFIYNETVVLTLIHNGGNFVNNFIKTLNENLIIKLADYKVYTCVGSLNGNIFNLSQNFKKLLPMLNVAKSTGNEILYYDKAGIYKLISTSNDINMLKEFYKSSIGILIDYDAQNSTTLYEYLRAYIETDGNLLAVAKKFFVHRNTVSNRLKKVYELTDINPLTLEGKLIFLIAIKIEKLYCL